MSQRVFDRLRARLEADLPNAFDKIFGHYVNLVAQPAPSDAKQTKEWLTNSRAALAQAEALLRMADRGEPPAAASSAEEETDIGDLLDEASRALAAFEGDDPPEEV